jgi:hypothetical protein
MNEFFSNFVKKFGINLKHTDAAHAEQGDTEDLVSHSPGLGDIEPVDYSAEHAESHEDSAQSLSKFLIGSPGIFGDFYFPSDFIGGSCPRVIGEEEEIVWNAAAEACDTERVHVVWQSSETTIWYLAVRSSELASHAGSWCPFASLLPGMKDAVAPPAIYTYYGEETATMMALTHDGLNIFRGSALVIRAKADRTSRELENAPIIELVPDRIMQLQPIPWYSVSLFEDRARRILATVAVVTAIGLAGLSFVVWLLASMTLLASRHDLSQTRERTENKTLELMQSVERLRKSPMRDQLASFADLNDGLLAVNGLLEVYEISEGKTRWRAIVPNNVTADRINDLGGKNIEVTPLGMAIGNSAEVDYEKSPEGRR